MRPVRASLHVSALAGGLVLSQDRVHLLAMVGGVPACCKGPAGGSSQLGPCCHDQALLGTRSSSAPPLHFLCSSSVPPLCLLCTSSAPPLHLLCSSSAPPLLLICTSSAPPLLLICTSSAPHLLLLCTSSAPDLHLLCSSSAPPLHLLCTWALVALRLGFMPLWGVLRCSSGGPDWPVHPCTLDAVMEVT
jgi:hypothetical protein